MVAILLGADNGFFYAGQIMHFSSPFTVFLIYHKQNWANPKAYLLQGGILVIVFAIIQLFK